MQAAALLRCPPTPARGRLSIVCAKKAKKGGKGKKGGGNPFKGQSKPNQKGGGSGIPKTRAVEPYTTTDVVMWNLLLVESYNRAVGSPILDDVDITDMSRTLYEAPGFALVTEEPSEDDSQGPVVNYANATFLNLMGCEWQDVVGQPSGGLLAADPEQAAADFEACTSSGMVEGYSAPLMGPKGTGVRPVDGRLFRVSGPTEAVLGAGLVFDTYEGEDGETVQLAVPRAMPAPTPEEMVAAEEAVAAQGGVVRGLKEEQGLGNDDEEVVAAVGELLRLKGVVTDMVAATEAAAAAAEAATAELEARVAAAAAAGGDGAFDDDEDDGDDDFSKYERSDPETRNQQ